jgi:hypothetical protein
VSMRPLERRREDIFFLLIITAILAVNFIGFAQTYYMAGLFSAPLPGALVHLHGALFSSWLLLLLIQTALVAWGKVRWHRVLGIAVAVVAMMMLIVGPLTLAAALKRHAFETEGGAAFTLVADIEGILIFAAFVVVGLFKRNNLIVHKRMMLFATIAILGPALSRWPFPFMDWKPAIFLLWLAFPVSVLLYETLSRRRPYKVSALSSLVILLYLLSVGPLAHMRPVRRVVRSMGYAHSR